MNRIEGFSKLTKYQKIEWLKSELAFKEDNGNTFTKDVISFWHPDQKKQETIDQFSENTISNFIIPFSIAPNFLINDKNYCVPMAIEESSVVAAAASAAKFWHGRGGFKTKVHGTLKVGHVHFFSLKSYSELLAAFADYKDEFLNSLKNLEQNMIKRGGGVKSLELKPGSDELENYYVLELKAETCDAMGANFLNSLLEKLASQLQKKIPGVEVIMAILSNYTKECLVSAEVSCPVSELTCSKANLSGPEFANRFKKAVDIATYNVDRAVTHNKGIFNGIDALVLATGNDFRAIEAAGHAYASRSGKYRSLSKAEIKDDVFTFSLTVPMALGTIGGLTKLHPLADKALTILGKPNASQLMQIAAALGLAQNFGALRSLITTGIQKGHMKMHLLNILNQMQASPEEIEQTKAYFKTKVITYNDVYNYLNRLRNLQ